MISGPNQVQIRSGRRGLEGVGARGVGPAGRAYNSSGKLQHDYRLKCFQKIIFAKITETIGKTTVVKFVSQSVIITQKILR